MSSKSSLYFLNVSFFIPFCCNFFLSFSSLPASFLKGIFWRVNGFNCDEVQCIDFRVFFVSYLRTFPKDFIFYFLQKLYHCRFYILVYNLFGVMIHFYIFDILWISNSSSTFCEKLNGHGYVGLSRLCSVSLLFVSVFRSVPYHFES